MKLYITAFAVLVVLSVFVASPAGGQTVPDVHLPLIRNDEVVATATPTPTSGPTPTRTPTPTNPPGDVITTNFNTFTYSGLPPGLLIVGEIINQTGQNIRLRRVTVTATDDSGQILGTAFNIPIIRHVAPGMMVPYVVLFENPPADANYQTALAWAFTDEVVIELQTTDVDVVFDNDDNFRADGFVFNDTNATIENAQVVAQLYDANDQLIGVSASYTDAIEPNRDVDFIIWVSDWEGKPDRTVIDHYSIKAYANWE